MRVNEKLTKIYISISGMTLETVKSLIGKNVVEFAFAVESADMPPTPEEIKKTIEEIENQEAEDLVLISGLNLNEETKQTYASEIDDLTKEFSERIKNCTTRAELEQLKIEYHEEVDKIISEAKQESLNNTKEDATVEVEAEYTESCVVDALKNLSDSQKDDFLSQLSALNDEAKSQIDSASSEEEVQKIKNSVKQKIVALAQNAQQQDAKELQDVKDNG